MNEWINGAKEEFTVELSYVVCKNILATTLGRERGRLLRAATTRVFTVFREKFTIQ